MLAELKKDNLAVIQFVGSSRGPLFLVLFELAQPPPPLPFKSHKLTTRQNNILVFFVFK